MKDTQIEEIVPQDLNDAVTQATSLHRDDDFPEETHAKESTIVGMGQRQLIDNFRSILEMNTIYYPVAYRLNRRLGEGRQGVVFHAQRQGSRGCFTKHAVKIFDPGIYSSVKKYWTDMGRIAAQISRLQSTRSPNLVDIDIYEETNGIGYIQMELIDGINLREFLNEKNHAIARQNCTPREWSQLRQIMFNYNQGALCIQPGVAVHIMRQMLSGLETLHSARYLHCDVKPLNTMIDPLGYVRIIDFGRANFINEKTTILLGTPMYMAPEIHERKPATIQSDLYSVGLLGLEMLSGRPLTDRPTTDDQKLLAVKHRLPETFVTRLPAYVRRNDHLVSILQRLLHPDPKQRFPDARTAETSSEGLALVHKQLTQLDIDSDYRRDLGYFLGKLGFPKSS